MRKTIVALALLPGFLLGSCGGSGAPEGESQRNRGGGVFELQLTAVDFGYAVRDERISAGEVKISLANEGEQPHQALLYRLNENVAFDDFKRSIMRDESTLPQLATAEGGMTEYAAAGEVEVTEGVDLEPGAYAIICFVRDQSLKTNKNHAELGMIGELVVE